MSDLTLRIGTASYFVRFSFPQPPGKSWDGRFNAEVRVGQFSANAECWDYAAIGHSISAFATEVSALHKALKGQATFNPLDDQIKLVMSADAFGLVHVSGFLYETAKLGTHLNFEFEIDQTYLPEILAQLKQLGL